MITDFRRQLHRAAYRVLDRSGVALWYRRSAAIVFCYHNVVPDELAGRVGNPWLHAGISEFTDQIEWISGSFTVVPIHELLSRLQDGRTVKGLAALSFDDGYTGAVRHAIPVMRHASLPFGLFPVINAADDHRPFWWDLVGNITSDERERYLTALKGDRDLVVGDRSQPNLSDDILPASWDMLRSVQGDDCAIGVHGVTHRNLAALQPEQIAWELTHARERLTDEIGQRPDVIAYPYGRTNPMVIAETERAGFGAGFGLEFGLIRPGTPRFNLGRINVPAGLPMATFACWASGLHLRG